jgi:hypothetical protein
MDPDRTKQEEVNRNFEFFKRELPQLMPKYAGKFALIRDCKVIAFYDTAQDANTAGAALHPDGLFSIQKVSEEVGDLGFYSHAVHLGAA